MPKFVLLTTVTCKMIGYTNGCYNAKYIETQTNQNSLV